jgi:bacterioferritin-associated ferredoxin
MRLECGTRAPEDWRKTGPIATRRPKSFSGKLIVFVPTRLLPAWGDNPRILRISRSVRIIEASRRRCTATLRAMIICSCNVLSDDDVRVAVTSIRQQPCTPGRIYGCLGCSVRCGRCARTVQRVVDDALAACRARGAARPSPATSPEPAFSHVEVVPTINGPQKPLIGFSSKDDEPCRS